MSYFTISHLAFRQAYSLSTGDQCCMGILRIKGTYKWNICMLYGITFFYFTKSPSIHYY